MMVLHIKCKKQAYLLQTVHIADQKFKDNVLKTLADEYSRTILTSIMDKPKSVFEISAECNIPMSTTYRRIHDLEKAGLVHVTGSIIKEDGKKYFLYRSRIKAVRTVFGIGSLDVEIIPNDEMGKSAYW